MPLTHFGIRNTKPPDKPFKISDGGGLYLLVQPRGAILWRLKYRYLGKERALSFGAYLSRNREILRVAATTATWSE